MNANIAAILYLVSGVLFILSLRGLSSPATSQAGARNGMIGMAIAIATTLWMAWENNAGLDGVTIAIIVGGIAVGGIVGAVGVKPVRARGAMLPVRPGPCARALLGGVGTAAD